MPPRCDNLADGYFLLCVRSVRPHDVPDVANFPPHPRKVAGNKGKPLAVRILATIDILLEPISDSQVHPIPSHPIPSHPTPSHPTRSHPIPSDPIPSSASQVRFCFQITQPLPPNTPRWIVNFILQRGMADIFNRMKQTASGMRAGHKSAHHDRVTSKAYASTRAFFDERISKYLRSLQQS